MAIDLGWQMSDMPDQMAHLYLDVFIAVRNGLFAVTGGVRIAVTGLFGANLEFGDFQGVVGALPLRAVIDFFLTLVSLIETQRNRAGTIVVDFANTVDIKVSTE